ncbi:MAG: MMPL family transporter [Actinomycetaceae bacterium]|nr:MMPL family transporter [Arcanobacterium sp.]MDD7504489.1 MMPL family transporter [Actinomycetaceae bacterium]
MSSRTSAGDKFSAFLISRKSIPLRILLLLLWLAAFAFGGMAQGKIGTVTQNDQAVFLPTSAESTLASEAAKPFQDSATIPALLVAKRSHDAKLSDSDMADLRSAVETLPDVRIDQDLAFSELLVGPVVVVPNEENSAALIPATLDANRINELDSNGNKLLNSAVDAMRAHFGSELSSNPDLQVYVSGPVGLAADLAGAFAGIDLTLLLVALVVVFIILVVVYRSVLMPVTVLLTAMAALCGAVLVVYELAKADVVSLNSQTQGILAILVIGATTDYCLLLIARYREELSVHESPLIAMSGALKGSWEPILASGMTVIAGLLALLVSDLSSTASLGPIAALGIVFAILAAFTLLPGILLVPGKHARIMFWPAKIKHYDSEEDAITKSHGIWDKVAHAAARHDRPVWISVAVILAVFAAFAPSFTAEGTSATEQFRGESESAIGFEILEEEFDAGSSQPTIVVTKRSTMDEAIAAIEGIDGVTSVSPQIDGELAIPAAVGMPPGGEAASGNMPEDMAAAMGGGAPSGVPTGEGMPSPEEMAASMGAGAQQQAPAEPVVIDGRVLLNVSTSMPAEDKAAQGVVSNIREAMESVDRAALVGGPAAQSLDTNLTAERDFHVILPVILSIIAVLLMLLLRSIVAPLLLLVANVLSFGTALGISKILFFDILDHPGADSSVPIYAFVFLVALGIDYTIFLMSRVREESIRLGTREGIVKGVAVTGGVITSAGIVLAATFAALVVVPLLFMFQLAIIVALGILIDTFIVRSLLVPGLVHDIGKPVWWPWTAKKVPADHK